VNTPTLERLAAKGLRYVNMHTTVVCSPTCSCNTFCVGKWHLSPSEESTPRGRVPPLLDRARVRALTAAGRENER
jgi:arylsulfatase A-like enzyme